MNKVVEVFRGEKIRGTVIDDKPVAIAADVADALNYNRTWNLVQNVKDKYKFKAKVDALDHNQKTYCLTEPGVYEAALNARETDKRPWIGEFQDFVYEQLLPSVRRLGMPQPDYGLFFVEYNDQKIPFVQLPKEFGRRHTVFGRAATIGKAAGYANWDEKGFATMNKQRGISIDSRKFKNLNEIGSVLNESDMPGTCDPYPKLRKMMEFADVTNSEWWISVDGISEWLYRGDKTKAANGILPDARSQMMNQQFVDDPTEEMANKAADKLANRIGADALSK